MARAVWLLGLSVVVFIIIKFANGFFLELFNVDNVDIVNRFYNFITVISAVMIVNLLMVYLYKIKYVGYTFLIWSMLKIMLVMGFFIVFVLKPKLQIGNCVIFSVMSVYFMYLIYEVFFAMFLLKEKIPAV